MKKILFSMLVALVGLAACSSDNDDDKVKLNKLTKITCYKNSEATPLYQVEFFYNPDGNLSYLLDAEKGRQEFIYVDKVLTVSGPSGEKTAYAHNNNFVTRMATYTLNPHADNTVYINEEYTYTYKRNKLNSADRLLRWPAGDGLSYETRTYGNYDNYTWEGDNITRFSQDSREMVYEYTSDKQPGNLPFKVQNTFNPAAFEFYSPINFMRGALNNHLVSRAYWYNVPQANISAEYLFDYTFRNEYVTTIFIEENSPVTAEENTYVIHLEYNYQN